jgi:putative acetyltransferase
LITIEISAFVPQDQPETKALILAGLIEHWGILDPTVNPDLEDIAQYYDSEIFLLAKKDGKIIGTGALIRENAQTGRVVRMSVAKDMRRFRIGSRLLEALCAAARTRGYRQLVLETTTSWQDAKEFYLNFGFNITGYAEGNTHFKLSLEDRF